VSGVSLNGKLSSAIINKKTVLIGEMIEGVRLVGVLEDEVMVEFSGFTNRISRFDQQVSPTPRNTSPR